MPLMIPILEAPDISSPKHSATNLSSKKSDFNISLRMSRKMEASSVSLRQLNQVDEDIEIYKRKMGESREHSMDQLEGFYEGRAKRMEDEIEELSRRRMKIQKDRETLGKENRRLVERLRNKERECQVAMTNQQR